MAAPIRLNPYLTVNLNSQVCSHRCKGTFLKIAAITSAVAILVIFGALSAIYLGLLATPPAWSIVIALIGALAATKGLNLWKKGSEQFATAASIKEITTRLKEISTWGKDRIRLYFEAKELDINEIPVPVIAKLRELSPKEPLKALLPLIARELVLIGKYDLLEKVKNEHLGNSEDTGFNKFKSNPSLEFLYFKKGVEAHEQMADNVLNRTLLLRTLEHPNHQYMFGLQQKGPKELHLWEKINNEQPTIIAQWTPKSFESRTIDYTSFALSGVIRQGTFLTTPRRSYSVEKIAGMGPVFLNRSLFYNNAI